MENTFWQKQTKENPLFPDLLWNKPENKLHSGKLLIIGGNSHGFAPPAESYQCALDAGIGQARVLMPDSLKKTVGAFLENCYFAPSNKIGSFSRQALAELVEHANWADGVFIAGELGHNSETTLMLEGFIEKIDLPMTITNDASDYFMSNPSHIFDRNDTTLVLDMSQLQKFASKLKSAIVFKFSMDLNQLAQTLREFSINHHVNIVVKHLDNIWVASGGRVSSTKLNTDIEVWGIPTAAKASVWWIQNPTKPYEAITTSLISE